MSRRHDHAVLPITRPEVTAHARAERHRVKSELDALAFASLYDDCDEPGVAFRAPKRRLIEGDERPERSALHGFRAWLAARAQVLAQSL